MVLDFFRKVWEMEGWCLRQSLRVLGVEYMGVLKTVELQAATGFIGHVVLRSGFRNCAMRSINILHFRVTDGGLRMQ